MSDSHPPQNRRQRRAAARETEKTGHYTDPSTGIKYVTPDFDSKPKGKTLVQIAEEKRALLSKGQPFAKETSSPSRSDRNDDDQVILEEPLSAFANAVLYCLSLSMLHFTLDLLVLSQYRQPVVWSEIVGRLGRMTPALFFVLWLLHTPQITAYKTTRQMFFLSMSIVSGCFLIYSGNVYGYYHVMKRAPPVGTLWVWSVVEMELLYAVAHAVAIVGYMWWNGFGDF
jgi:hypothetical protein